jgi:outer membrane receptor protein involved in Fe transport
MKHCIYLLLITAFVPSALAQKITLSGNVTDTTGKPLGFATLLLLHASDSSLAAFTRSEEKGSFELKNVSPGRYVFKATFVGFRSHTQTLTAENTALDLGTIRMQPIRNELQEVTIRGEKNPVTIKQDTIEYNAGSFRTKPNGTVEDMIKKMPGIEVQSDGTVKAQGETVKRVTVNGKEFFGRDPKVATRNLPADAIDKVQVYDKKSDQATFSGIDDGQREKTINLELKDKEKKLNFGNFMAGVGTDQRFETKANYNYFDKTKQFSLLGMGNNVNQQGFSIDDYMNFTGALQRMASGGGAVRLEVSSDNADGVPLSFGNTIYGFMKSWAGGANFNNQLTAKTEVNGSYFFNQLSHIVNQDLTRQNFLPNGTFVTRQNSGQNNENTNHRLNFTLDHKIDSLNSLKWTSYASYNQTTAQTNSRSQTFGQADSLENEGTRTNHSYGDALSLNSNLLLRHRFRTKGRTLSANLTLAHTGNGSNGNLQAENIFYNGTSPQALLLHQTNEQSGTANTYGANLSYTEPVAKRKYLEINYGYQKNRNSVNRKVYDIGNETEVLNTNLSNRYTSDFTYNRLGLNFRVNQKKYNFAIGIHTQHSSLEGRLLSRDTAIDRTFANLLPTARLNYDFSTNRHLNFNYETQVTAPSVSQLQPVVDNSDPLTISVGNPNLRPEYSHSWRTNYVAFNPANFSSFFSMFNVTYTTNKIVYAQNLDANLVRTIRPVNVRDYLSATGDVSLGFRIKPINSRLNVGTAMTYDKGINWLNDQQSRVNQYVNSGSVSYEYRYKEVFDISLAANLSYQQTRYEFNREQNQAFLNETYTAEANLSFLKNFHLNTSLNYAIYKSLTTDFYQQVPVWSASLSGFFLKNKRGELKLSGINLLDRTLGVNQRTSVNYLEQERIRSLGRYFMLSFTYSLNKAFDPAAGRRGGMIRMIRR